MVKVITACFLLAGTVSRAKIGLVGFVCCGFFSETLKPRGWNERGVWDVRSSSQGALSACPWQKTTQKGVHQRQSAPKGRKLSSAVAYIPQSLFTTATMLGVFLEYAVINSNGSSQKYPPCTCNRCQRLWALIADSDLAFTLGALRFLFAADKRCWAINCRGRWSGRRMGFVTRILLLVGSPRRCSLAKFKWLRLHAARRDKRALEGDQPADPRKSMTFPFFYFCREWKVKWIWQESFSESRPVNREKSSLFRRCHWLFKTREMGIERDITLQF